MKRLRTNTVSTVLGLRAMYSIAQPWGVISPMGRIEYRHAFSNQYTQTLSYADQVGGPTYALAGVIPGRDQFTGAVGVKVSTLNNLTFDMEYRLTGAAHLITQGVRGALRYGF